MKQELKDYTEALEAHIQAQRNEMSAKHEILASRHRLNMARSALKDREKDLIEETIK